MMEGFTTGSCAAAAAKAATYMLLSGRKKESIDITVPRGDVFHTDIVDIMSTNNSVRCAVVKDAGDDPDVTNGCRVYAEVRTEAEDTQMHDESESDDPDNDGLHNAIVRIHGGEGIGRVTRPGLDQPVGEAAINHVPREMIMKEVQEVCGIFDHFGTMDVTISVPGGEEIAKKTFNPRLGIEGGISIIGTSGIVEPMSRKAVQDTIFLELRQRREAGSEGIVISPGNYGRDFLKKEYGYDIDNAVKISNFAGAALDMCVELGYREVLLAGHIGKLVKLAAGIMNTHSHEADARMETIAAAGIRAGLPGESLLKILDAVSTTEALGYVAENGEEMMERVMSTIMDRIEYYLAFRTKGQIRTECMVYCDEYGLLGQTAGAGELIERL
jgi:cobalt-precorrin-5B (C1)-methyltransferase